MQNGKITWLRNKCRIDQNNGKTQISYILRFQVASSKLSANHSECQCKSEDPPFDQDTKPTDW